MILSWNLSFDLLFWSLLPKLSWLPFIVESTFEHICFLVEFSFLVGYKLAKSVSCLFRLWSDGFCWKHFQKDSLFCFCFYFYFQVNFLKSFSFRFLELAFHFASFCWMKVFLLSWVFLLIFRRIALSLIPSKYSKWQKGNLVNKNNFYFFFRVVFNLASSI